MGGSLTGLGENGERRIASASTDLGAHGTGSGSGGGSGGGSAGLAGSGSSASPARVADLAAEPGLGANGSYDLSAGGGFRSVGLKPSKGDLAEVAAEGGAPALDETKLDEDGNKDPAAEAAAAEEAMGEDSDSIFLRVKQKYALLKGAGKI